MSTTDEVDFTVLPLEERLNSKLWKARLHGYEELISKFEKISDSNGNVKDFYFYFRDATLFQSYLSDSNVIALEKSIAALLTLLKKFYNIFSINVNKIVPIENLIENWVPLLIEKGITSSRASTKNNSIQAILYLISFDKSIENICEFIVNNFLKAKKLPKIILASLITITNLINNFQFENIVLNKVFENQNSFLMELIDILPTLTSNADKNIRSQAIDLILQIFDKIGRNKFLLQEILLDKLKPIQQRDLDKLFDKLSNGGEGIKSISNLSSNLNEDIIIYYLNNKANFENQQLKTQSQLQPPLQSQSTNYPIDEDGDTNMDINGQLNSNPGNNQNIDIDPFTLLKEETILDKLPENFNERITSAKWKDRVEVLQEFHDNVLSKAKKLKSSGQDYSNIISILANIIHKDANVQSVTIASQSIAMILEKLRLPGFNKSLVNICFVPLLDRTKEKKPSVIEAIRNALYLLVKYYNPISNTSKHGNQNNEDLLQEIIKSMKNKIPQIRLESTVLFNHILKNYFAKDSEKILSMYLESEILPNVLKTVSDTQPTIRTSGFEAFAILSNIFISNDEIKSSFDKLDSMKKKKITDLMNSLPNLKENLNSTSNRDSRTVIPSMDNNNNLVKPIIPSKRGPTSPLKKFSGKANSPVHLSQNPVITLPNKSMKSSNFNNNNNNTTSSANDFNVNALNSNNKRIGSDEDRILNEEKRIKLELEVENLKKEKHVWLKEKHELINQLNTIQNKQNSLLNELEVLKEQLKNSQTTLHDKNLQLRQKDLQLNKLQDRISHISESNAGSNRRSSLLPHTTVPVRLASAKVPSINDIPLPHSSGEQTKHKRTDSVSSEDLPHRVDLLQIDSSSNVNDTFVNEESWKRAAEVTSQLKARIERMRAKTRE